MLTRRSLLALLPFSFALRARAAGKDTTWDDTVEKAIAYLRKAQSADGSWGGKQNPGITGVVLTGLLRTGKVTAKDPMAERALAYIESLIDPKEGHIAGKGARAGLLNYVTSVNVLAL